MNPVQQARGPADRPRFRQLSVTTATVGFIVTVFFSVFALTGWQIWKARDAQMREAQTAGADLARSLALQADSTLKAVDTVLVGLVWRFETEARSPGYRERMHEHLVRQARELPQLVGILVYDENGNSPLDSFDTARTPVNVLDRDYFQYHRTHPERGPRVSPLIRSKITGQWLLPVTRRLNHPDGRFAGVIVATVNPQYFQRFYNAYDLGADSAISLVHETGMLIVRRPYVEQAVGASFAATPLFQRHLPRAPAGHFVNVSRLDNIEKLNSYRRLDHYPLIVVVGRPVREILAEWRSGALLSATVASILVCVLALLGIMLLKTLQRNLRTESSLLASEKRIRIISDNLPLAIGYTDADEKMQFANLAFAASVRRSVDEVLGQSFADLLGERYAERVQYVKAALAGEAVRFERTALIDGRIQHLESRYIPDVDDTGKVQGFYGVTVDISARKQLELEQQNAHRELQTIIDHMPSLVGYWGPDMRNRFGNQPYLAWYGIAPDEMRNRHIREVIGAELFEENRPLIEAALEGRAQLFEKSIADANGVVRAVVASYVPDLRHGQVVGFYEFITDITSLKQARNAQFEARAQLQGVIDAAREFSIVATDLKGVIQIFSTGAERMLGYRAQEMVGRRTPAILHLPSELAERGMLARGTRPGGEIDYTQVIEASRNGQTQSGEWTYVRKDGSHVPVYLITTAIQNAQGEVTGLLGVARDITGQKQLLSSLNAAKEQAEAASRAKSEFVANMSHEIRTPMNAVLGIAQMLGNTPLSPDQRKFLDMIQEAGKSLLDILNDILDFSKVEAGRMELAPAPFRLSAVLKAVATLMIVNGSRKDLEIVIGVEPDVPDALIGDAQRLQQILLNLAGNAIKFTERGEVAVLVSLTGGGEGEAALRFAVRDTGIGISPAQQRRLFKPFSQAEESTARRFGGTGLGLAISRRMTELMHGTITVQSKAGEGSTFRVDVTLPRDTAAPRQNTLVHGVPAASLGPRRVLLIDRHATGSHYLALTMRAWGWEVDTAANGVQGLERLRGQAYDFVLADWPTDEPDCEQALREVRAQCASQDTRYVVLVTPFAREKLAQTGWAEAHAILLKPVTASTLYDTLNEALYAEARALAPAGETAPAALPAPRGGGPLAGVRLLLVEDNAFNQVVARGLLEQSGASVAVADNGKLALDHLAQHRGDYDMILMDVQMPVMDGFMATRAIRDQLGLDLPILAMSAGVMLGERDACVAAGMNDFIPKPIEQDYMIAMILRHLAGDKPAPAAVPETTGPAAVPDVPEDFLRSFERMLQFRPDDAAYRRGIVDFIRSMATRGPQLLEQAQAAWREGRHADCARQFHTMRGSVGTLGAKRFAQAALAVEEAIAGQRHDEVEARMARAGVLLGEVVEAARAWLAVHDAAAPVRDAAAAPLDTALLAQLRTLLAEQNMAACEAYDALRPGLAGRLDEAALAELDQAVARLAFARALALLQAVSA
jgi:two-component system sensor histidine kinase/response regulator